jgi:GT2 family glycosyltransferase
VSFVIGTRDRSWYLERTIESIRDELAPPEAEVIVVEGGSSDGSAQWLAEQRDVQTIHQTRQGSWGMFMNLGFRAATGRVVCMLSDDCLLVPGAIRNGLARFDTAGQRVGAVAFYWRNWPEQRRYRVGLTFGGRMFVNHGLFLREALESIGFADEDAFAFYHADGDLALRLAAAGWSCVDSPGSYVEHYSHANLALRSANATRQPADWAAYVDRWGHLGSPTTDWLERSYSDPHRTADRAWGRHQRLRSNLVALTARARLAVEARLRKVRG